MDKSLKCLPVPRHDTISSNDGAGDPRVARRERLGPSQHWGLCIRFPMSDPGVGDGDWCAILISEMCMIPATRDCWQSTTIEMDPKMSVNLMLSFSFSFSGSFFVVSPVPHTLAASAVISGDVTRQHRLDATTYLRILRSQRRDARM